MSKEGTAIVSDAMDYQSRLSKPTTNQMKKKELLKRIIRLETQVRLLRHQLDLNEPATKEWEAKMDEEMQARPYQPYWTTNRPI